MSKFSKSLVIVFVILLPVLVFSFLNGCDKDPVSSQADYRYPFKVGNSWAYSGSYHVFNREPDSIFVDFDTITSTANVMILSSCDSLGLPGKYLIESVMKQGLHEYVTRAIILHDSTGLRIGEPITGVGGAELFIPYKTAVSTKLKFAGKEFSNLSMLLDWVQDSDLFAKTNSSDSLSEDTLTYSLKYPLTVGSRWKFRTDPIPFTIDKEVIGKEKVKVPAGSFSCFKIEWQYDMNQDSLIDTTIVIHDYIGSPGLVRREITIDEITHSTEWGNDSGSFSLKQTIDLTAYDLK